MSLSNDSRRRRPYIWVTWLTGLLAETDNCQWAAWYKAHYRYGKRPDEGGFDLEQWTKDHDAMVEQRVKELRDGGFVARVEDQNAFKLAGKLADVAGKPDIVAGRPKIRHALVIDEKSGNAKARDVWQVLVYMFALPLTWAKGYEVQGELEYRNDRVPISAGMLDPDARQKIVDIIQLVGGDEMPPRSPSARECRFCPIAACPDRVETETKAGDASGLF